MPKIPKTETLIISWDSNPAHPISLTREEISAAAKDKLVVLREETLSGSREYVYFGDTEEGARFRYFGLRKEGNRPVMDVRELVVGEEGLVRRKGGEVNE